MTGAANDRASGWMGGIQTGMNALGMAINYNNQQNMTNAFAKYYGS
jgi:acyl CoA:acetate/3-ketoacid CoA transferase